MSIFSNIWSKIKSIPEQYKAVYQIGARGMAGLAKQKLTAALGIQPKPTFQAPIGAGLTPQAAQTAQQIASGKIPGPSQIQATMLGYTPLSSAQATTGLLSGQYTPQQAQQIAGGQVSPYQTYYQPSVTQPTTTYQAPTPTGQPIGEYVPPPQAPSGQAGVSYQQAQPKYATQEAYTTGGYSYTPYQAPSGAAGGVSAHTGLLGGVSAGLGLPSVSQDEKEKTIEIPQGATLSGIAQQQGLSLQQLLAANPQITDPNVIRAGEQLRIPQPQPQPTGLKLPSIITKEGALDLTAAETGISQIKDLLKSPLTKQTQSQVMEYLENTKNTLLQGLQQEQPLPEEPMPKPEFVADDKKELDYLDKTPKQQYEDLARIVGLPTTITDLENTYKELQATDQAFNAIIEDINSDPDFPKGLARRRIQAIEEEKGVRIKALQSKLELLQTMLTLKREEFKDRLGITEKAIAREQEQKEQERKTAQDEVQRLISSEGISEMSDTELAQLAQSAGYTLSSLRKIRDAVKSQSQAKITKAQNDLIKQQHDMKLAEQREARLAGGETTTGEDTTETIPLSPEQIPAVAQALEDSMGKKAAVDYLQANNQLDINGTIKTLNDNEKQQIINAMGGQPTGATPTTPTTTNWMGKIGGFFKSLLIPPGMRM